MQKCRVQLPAGTEVIRLHRPDNTFMELKTGDIVDADEIPGQQRIERLYDKHLVPLVPDPTPAAVKPDAAPVKGKK